MKDIRLDNLTQLAEATFAGAPDARRKELSQALIRHVHGFAKEVHLTHEEWRAAIDFFHRVGEISTPQRSEFTLLSDVLGLSSLVDLLDSPPEATPGSVLGPFHTVGSPWLDNPANLIRNNPGERVLLRGAVRNPQGEGLTEATLDVWQNAANGQYWQLDPQQPSDNLRCQLKVDSKGGFEIATIRPAPYCIPTDGPVWLDFIGPAQRSAWRPAHFHVIVKAPGYRTLVTEVFEETDPYLDTDAVFGVRKALIGRYEDIHDPQAAARMGLTGPLCRVMTMDFVLAL